MFVVLWLLAGLVKFDEASLDVFLARNRDASRCIKPDCKGLVEVADRALLHCTCPLCKTQWCRRCRVAWHAGFSCQVKRAVLHG